MNPGIIALQEEFSQLLTKPNFGNPLAQTTIVSYVAIIRQFIKYMEMHEMKVLGSITEEKLENFFLWNINGSISKKLTISVRLAALKRFFSFAVEKHAIASENALTRLEGKIAKDKRQGGRSSGAALPVVLRWKEQEFLLATVDQYDTIAAVRDSAMIACALDTGLREHELVGMTLAHADDYFRGRLKIKGKGDKERVVVFHPQYTDRIKVWLSRRGQMIEKNQIKTELLWMSDTGNAMELGHFSKQVRRWLGRAEIKAGQGGSHLIRHTACSRMLARGMDIVRVQNNMGHASIATTQLYAHLLDSE